MIVLDVRIVAGSLLFNCLSIRLRFDSNFPTAPPCLVRVIAIGILLEEPIGDNAPYSSLLTLDD